MHAGGVGNDVDLQMFLWVVSCKAHSVKHARPNIGIDERSQIARWHKWPPSNHTEPLKLADGTLLVKPQR